MKLIEEENCKLVIMKNHNIKPVGVTKDIKEALDEDTYINNESLENLKYLTVRKSYKS